MELAQYLKALRLKLGFESARSFHQWLESQVQIDCNYSYYSRLESGQVVPSATLITTLGGVLNAEDSDGLTLAYCRTLFPNKRKLFTQAEGSAPIAVSPKIHSPTTQSKAKGMSIKQVSMIGSSKLHYSLFLIATMARKPVFTSQFESVFGKKSGFENALHDLESVQILRKTNDGYLPVSTEIKFPSADSVEIKKLYSQLDTWDHEIGDDLKLQTSKKKFLFRRISPRYIPMIETHCQLLMDLIRASEEIDPALNEEVISFSLKLMKGRVAG